MKRVKQSKNINKERKKKKDFRRNRSMILKELRSRTAVVSH